CFTIETADDMDRSLSISLLCLGFMVGNGLFTQGSKLWSSDPSDFYRPHFTDCRSREQETFRCWWSTGSFQNLSEPGALRVFYTNDVLSSEWQECPNYTLTVENECYFSKDFTSVWKSYCIQLRSVPQNITYDENCFTVENIVHPDPPVGLNWTLLNVSRSGLYVDILVHWKPPPSADVKSGWLNLVYQVQYQVKNTTYWETLELERGTQQSIYGMLTNEEYEVRVRSKMSGFRYFGEFSESVIVHVPHLLSKEPAFPMMLLLMFGVIGAVILIVAILFSQQHRGMENQVLTGKLEQLNSLLSSQNMYKTDFYHEDPWVEFIQLDLDDPTEKSETSDTQHLLGLSRSSSAHVLSFKSDDDSGRASCYDPEFLDPEDLASLIPSQHQHPVVSRSSSSIPDPSTQQTSEEVKMPIQIQPALPNSASMDFYAQVSDFTPAGGVVLSPGQPNSPLEKKKEDENGMKIQLLLISDGAYTSETTARQLSTDVPSPIPGPDPGYQQFPSQCVEGNLWNGDYLVTVNDSQTPYLLLEAPPTPMMPPMSDYTIAEPPPKSSFSGALGLPTQPR
ncbi:hypothetical protein DNTS_033766, partial [Danionella cerebrum]